MTGKKASNLLDPMSPKQVMAHLAVRVDCKSDQNNMHAGNLNCTGVYMLNSSYALTLICNACCLNKTVEFSVADWKLTQRNASVYDACNHNCYPGVRPQIRSGDTSPLAAGSPNTDCGVESDTRTSNHQLGKGDNCSQTPRLIIEE